MRTLKNIDVTKSISIRKLCYSKSWLDYFDTIVVILYFTLGLIVCPVLFYVSEFDYPNPGPNEKFVFIVLLPAVILFGVYMVFRKITELRLRKITSEFNKDLNRKLILEFAKQDDFSVRRKYNDCIVLDKSSLLNPIYAKTAVLFVCDEAIYFTMIQGNSKVNLPTFISHFFFEWRIKKWFRQNLSLKLKTDH